MNVSCSLASGEQIILHRRVQLHVCVVLQNGQYVTAQLEALVAQMSVSHAGLGGSSPVELSTLFIGNIGWVYSRSLSAVDVASAEDDLSFA